jgi:3-keto-L-gulonate-6-phosphate decarboxylase
MLEVDGGVKVDNIAEIGEASADTFVAGSAIFGAADYARRSAHARGAVRAAPLDLANGCGRCYDRSHRPGRVV